MEYKDISMLPEVYAPVRFVLAKKGANRLIVIGFNPSTATEAHPDNTMQSVLRIATFNGYDGFIMMNVYPLRSTSPQDLPREIDGELHAANLRVIAQTLRENPTADILLAYGNLITLRDYTRRCARDIIELIKQEKRNVKCIKVLKTGFPQHPLYASSRSVLQPYNP